MAQAEPTSTSNPITTGGFEEVFEAHGGVQGESKQPSGTVNAGSWDSASTVQEGSLNGTGSPLEASLQGPSGAAQPGLTVKEASDFYKLSANSVRLKIKLNEIPAVKIDGTNGPEWRIFPNGIPPSVTVKGESKQPSGTVHAGSLDSAITVQEGSLNGIGSPQGASLQGAGTVQVGLSKEELLEALDDFRASFERDFSPPAILDRGQEIEGLQRELIDGQKMMMALMADKLRDREALARLEAEIKLLPDLQGQAARAAAIEEENEALKQRLQETEATLSAVKQSWWGKLFGGFGK